MGLLRRNRSEPEEEADQNLVVLVERAVDPHLVMFHDPHSAEAEQFRGLRNQIVTMNRERAPRSIVVTSAISGEGKSVTTLNLALAFTELQDTRVVVLDGDLRHPSLETMLGMPRRRGLSDVLAGRYPLDRALQRTAFGKLSLVGAGALPDNPAELVAAERSNMLVNALKENFNYILIDAPPTLELTDAGVLGHVSDGVILVVRLEWTPRQEVERAIAVVENAGANMLGTFLVGARAAKRKSNYHYGSAY